MSLIICNFFLKTNKWIILFLWVNKLKYYLLFRFAKNWLNLHLNQSISGFLTKSIVRILFISYCEDQLLCFYMSLCLINAHFLNYVYLHIREFTGIFLTGRYVIFEIFKYKHSFHINSRWLIFPSNSMLMLSWQK